MLNNYTVYKHTFPNGKVYIGITKQAPSKRWRNGTGYLGQKVLYNAILKYGWDNVKHEILYADLSKEEAEQKEIEMISFHKSNQHDYGYNVANGGKCAYSISEATKEKIRQANIGKHLSIETRKKMSISRFGSKNSFYGKRHTEEAKEKVSQGNKGRTQSAEEKKKRSEALKGHIVSKETKLKMSKSVYCVELNKVFPSIKEAGVAVGITDTNITNCCKGRIKTAGGYHWKYAEELV